METARAAKKKGYYESDRKHILNLIRDQIRVFKEKEKMRLEALKDDHDASMLVMGSKTEVKEMQGPEHPHTSGDETGVDRSSGESERSTETHANPSGYEQNSRAPGSSR